MTETLLNLHHTCDGEFGEIDSLLFSLPEAIAENCKLLSPKDPDTAKLAETQLALAKNLHDMGWDEEAETLKSALPKSALAAIRAARRQEAEAARNRERQNLEARLVAGTLEDDTPLKALYNEAEWPEVRDRILPALEAHLPQTQTVYLHLLAEAGRKAELLAHCQKDPDSLPQVYTYLLPEFSADVANLLVDLIHERIARAKGRKAYGQIGLLVLVYADVRGQEAGRDLITALCQQYPRRHALQDELARLPL